MKKIALLFGLLLATPAFAADNAVIVTPGVGVTMKSKDIGAGVQAMQPILSDASGNALLTTLGADAVSNTLTGIPVYSRQLFYNGTTWDRWQGAVTLTSGTLTTVSTVTNLSQMGGQAIAMGTGVRSAGTQRVTIATDDVVPVSQSGTWNITNISGTVSLPTGAATSALQTTGNTSLATIATNSALPLPAQTGIGNINIGAVQSAGSAYKTVAASATATVLGATGAIGDYLSHCVIYPASTSPGVVTVFDNANAAATNVIAFAGGATSTSNLTPISVPVGAISTAGAWKVTTGASVSVTCYGKFT